MKQPTAYAMFRDGEFYDAIHPDEYYKTAGEYDIPLYTHPVKELTDEEIEDLIDSVIPMILLGGRIFYRDFARAILRKAQEK